MSFEARTKHTILGGKIAGKVLIKLENNVINLKNTDGESKDSLELIVKAALGESLSIEGKQNGESMWTYNTKRSTKTRQGAIRYTSLLTRKTGTNSLPNSKLMFISQRMEPADTTVTPCVLKLTTPFLFKIWGIK